MIYSSKFIIPKGNYQKKKKTRHVLIPCAIGKFIYSILTSWAVCNVIKKNIYGKDVENNFIFFNM